METMSSTEQIFGYSWNGGGSRRNSTAAAEFLR
jgi:hypothetical protein